MKRPLALIGLTFLSVLAVVFYLPSPLTAALIIAFSVAAAAACAVLGVAKKQIKKYLSGIAAGITALAALMSIFLFQNYFAAPIIDKYAEHEFDVEGFICSELTFKGKFVSCTVQAEKADGEPCDFKLTLTTSAGVELHPFDKISFRAAPHASDYSYQLSRRIYLYAFDDGKADVQVLGRHDNTLDYYALRVRQAFRHSLENMLSPDAAAMAKAVLLGDKSALDSDVRDDFTKAGVSYLIVVSGMHLTIVTYFLRLILRKCCVNDFIAFALIALIVLAFIALTGFANSVTRAGIMMLMFYGATLFLRQSDSFSSLGIAALFFAVPNPYIVGDVGLLLSFAATFGILLWADKIKAFTLEKLGIDKIKPLKKELIRTDRLRNLLKRALRWVINLLSVSAAASMWVIPLTILLLGTVSPLTVIISLFAYPLTSVVLALSFPVALVGLVPHVRVIAMPLALVVNCFAWALQNTVHFFASLPFAQLRTDEAFWYVWLAVTGLLTVIGYLTHAKRRYVFAAIAVSAATLLSGGALTALLSTSETMLHIDVTQSGYVITAEKYGKASLLGAAGGQSDKTKALQRVSKTDELRNVLITSQNSRRYYAGIFNAFSVGTVLEFSDGETNADFSDEGVHFFGNNKRVTFAVSDDAIAKAKAPDKKVYVMVDSKSAAVLIIPNKGDAAVVKNEMAQADYIVLEGSLKNAEMLPEKTIFALNDKAKEACPAAQLLESGQSVTINLKTKELVTG